MSVRQLCSAVTVAAVLGGSTALARADGPPPPSLVHPEQAPPPDSLGAAKPDRPARAWDEIERNESNRRSRDFGGRHPTLRKVAFASGLGLAALALWRNEVAGDRAREYEQAAFTASAATLRERVRDAETERDVLGALSGACFSVAFLTLLY